ncbi:MAG: hypothetical protein G01um101448_575 [Parcubacteria group bacterium Gr01-1014_48]|nr:MAG: hypothetical protein Greene041614_199 [Parcubacteria group bacterium Greene0416_14]TSC73769.1 MAG: hypothetical protein G01um101448_575 [Parcubacteria group bacterium Gr01-1014_48]TSD01197.1 MAG: hypothetical protein Greene101415_392 [Parcubacteria group bacterium Greene1014_15]TSD08046.1 MAG: hypothetical protein Greene07144_469 [Parcubacteria group bacterium Greene0714_4]
MRKQGFTLLETAIAIVVSTIVLFGIMAAIRMFYRSNAYILDQAVTINNARRGIEALSRDIREATYGDDGSFPVSSIAEQSFVFFADIDTDIGIERVRYFVDATDSKLKRGIIDSSGSPLLYNPASEIVTPVAEHVRNIALATTTFRFYNESGVEITNFSNVADVAHVKMNLIVNVHPETAPSDFTLRSSATIRNLKTNL